MKTRRMASDAKLAGGPEAAGKAPHTSPYPIRLMRVQCVNAPDNHRLSPLKEQTAQNVLCPILVHYPKRCHESD